MGEDILEMGKPTNEQEHISVVNRKLRELQKKYDELYSRKENLRMENEKLRTEKRGDDLQYPSQLCGQKFISVKAYFKLKERYKKLDERFWEIAKELNELKKEEKL